MTNERRGLSPPTRGNHLTLRRPKGKTGSIPAHAGEPASRQAKDALAKVYPRPRGGTPSRRALPVVDLGLSPPTRGNLEDRSGRLEKLRSIPAHAGEPTALRARRGGLGVYPRPRGGTLHTIRR